MPIPFGAAIVSVLGGAAGALGVTLAVKKIEEHKAAAPQLPASAPPPQLPPAGGVKGAEEIIGCATCGDVGCGCAGSEPDEVSGWGIRVKFVDKGGIPVKETASGWAIPLRKVTDEPPAAKALPPGPSASPSATPPATVKGWGVAGVAGIGDQIFEVAKAAGGAATNVFVPGAGTALETAAEGIKTGIDKQTGHDPNAGPYAVSNLPGSKSAGSAAPEAPIVTSATPEAEAHAMQPGTVGWRGKNVWCGGAPGWVPITQGAKPEGVHGVETDDLGLVTDDLGADDLGAAPRRPEFGARRRQDGSWWWPSHEAHVAYDRAVAAWRAGEGGDGGGEEVIEIRGGRRVRVRKPHHHPHRHPHHKAKPHHHGHHGHKRGVRGFENEEGVEGMSDDLGFVELPAPKPASYGATALPNGQWKWPNNNALRAYVNARNAWIANHNRLEAQSRKFRAAPHAPKRVKVHHDLGSHAKERAARITCQQKLNKCHHHSYQRRLTIERLMRQNATLQSKLAWCMSALSAAQSQGVQLDPSLTASPVAYDPSSDGGSYVSDSSMDATFSDVDSVDTADADNFSDLDTDDGGDGSDDDTSGIVLDDLGLSEVQRDEIEARMHARARGGEVVGEQVRRGPRGKVEVTADVIKDGRLVEEHFEFPKQVNKHKLEIKRLHHAIAAVRSAAHHEEEHVRHLIGGVRALECEIERAMRVLGHENREKYWHVLFSPRGGIAGTDDMGAEIIEEIEVKSPNPPHRRHKRPEYEHTIRHLRLLLGEEEARLENDREHADRLLWAIRALEHLIRFGERFFHDRNERLDAEIAARRVSDGVSGAPKDEVSGEPDATGYIPYGGGESAPSRGSRKDERISGWQPLFATSADSTAGASREKDDLGGCQTCQIESPMRRYVDPLARYRNPGFGGRDDGLN